MTSEEKQQVQNLINARTKLLTEKAARQEEEIKYLTSTIMTLSAEVEKRDIEIDGLKTKLSAAQEQSQKLLALVQNDTPKPPEPSTPQQKQQEKPNYLLSLLRQHFGFDSFREGQEEIIDALLSGRDVFCSMPSGYGLSVCYRLPAMLMPGLTLAVTPEEPHDVNAQHCEILTASLTSSKRREILRKVKNGTCKILYSTMKELEQDDTLNTLTRTEISMTAILNRFGISHSLEDWKSFSESLSKKRIITGIFADETSPSLRQDLMRLSGLHSPLKVIKGFKRPNISVRVIKTEDKMSTLIDFLSDKKNPSGVIYCSTPETVYRLRERLRDFDGLDIITPDIESEHDALFTVHYDLPADLCRFSRQIDITKGRKSECLILAGRKEIKNAEKSVASFCESDSPKEFLTAYLGEDEKISPEKEEAPKNLTPTLNDYDFAGANEAQKEAITSTEGPLLIIAGPGTGKTFTLVQRVVFMIQKRQTLPENIMIVTFTDKAANEIISRITEELSRRNIFADTGTMYAGTFHTICARILREYSDSRNFRILDDFDHAYMIMQNMKRFSAVEGLSDALTTSGKWANSCELRGLINNLTEELADPEELIRDSDIAVKALGHAMMIHTELLRENNFMTYSSLLAETYRLLNSNHEVLADIQSKVKYIMVDEYQDTNYIQEQLSLTIAGSARNICAAGDDDQSIYRFRGSTVRNIIEFPGHFPENGCKVINLSVNYRSRPEIVKFFTEWINDTSKFFSWENFRRPKKLEASRESSKTLSVMRLAGVNKKREWHEKILHFITSLKESGKLRDYNQIAFLFRSVKSPDAQSLTQFLEENNINVYSPRSNMFFQRGEIQFAIGCIIAMFTEYMKALNTGAFIYQGSEPDYIAYYKTCLQTVTKYIDRPQYSPLKKYILERRAFHSRLNAYAGYTYSDLLYGLFAFHPFNHALNADINGTVKELRPARNLACLVSVIRKYEYSYNINNLHGKYIAGQFQMMMNIYLRFMIDNGVSEHENDTAPSGHVSVMTIHQSKGMEFPIVFADSLWSCPQTNETNEVMDNIAANYYRRAEFEPSEKVKYFDFWRLYYTAFTRAKDILILTCCEDNNTPSKYFESQYDRLSDADEAFEPSECEITPSKDSGMRKTYSFTGDVLTYENCPTQYKFFRELDFLPGRSPDTFLGKLIHAVLDDIHKAAIKHEESKIDEPHITEWFESEYEHLSRTEQSYLTKSARETALSQIMRYVQRRGSDWSSIRRSEYDVKAVRGDYILEGTIDLLSIRDGQSEITDFKSGAKPNININDDRERLENYRRQVFAYGWLLENSSGLKVDTVKIYFTGENSGNPEILFQYDSDEAEKVMKGFDQTVKRIADKDFSHKAPDIETCVECVFRHYCGRD